MVLTHGCGRTRGPISLLFKRWSLVSSIRICQRAEYMILVFRKSTCLPEKITTGLKSRCLVCGLSELDRWRRLWNSWFQTNWTTDGITFQDYARSLNRTQIVFTEKKTVGPGLWPARLSRTQIVFTEEKTAGPGLWPTRLSDLSACDFNLWEYLNGKLYRKNLPIVEELKDAIRGGGKENFIHWT